MAIAHTSGRAGSVMAAILALAICGCDDDGSDADFGTNNADIYVAIGDSITSGSGAGTSYPAILAGMLGKTVINAGASGARASSALGMANSALAKHKPAYLLILFGANDAYSRTSPGAVKEQLRAVVHAARNNSTVPVLATLTPMAYSHEGYNSAASSISDGIRSLASEEGVGLADLQTAFAGHLEYLQADGLHPNAEGMQVIAGQFAHAL